MGPLSDLADPGVAEEPQHAAMAQIDSCRNIAARPSAGPVENSIPFDIRDGLKRGLGNCTGLVARTVKHERLTATTVQPTSRSRPARTELTFQAAIFMVLLRVNHLG